MNEKEILLKKEELESKLENYFKDHNMNGQKNWYSYVDVNIWENYGKKRCYFKIMDIHTNPHCSSKTRRSSTRFGYLDMLTGEYVVTRDEKNLYELD